MLAGGAARRMGGRDKPSLVVAGRTLLDSVLAAARPECAVLVVVGPPRPTTVAGVVTVAEPVPGGGPVPAVRAGLAAVEGAGPVSVVLVLAADLPLLRTDHLARLVVAVDAGGAPAAAACDSAGRPVPLLAAYRAPVLAERVAHLGPDPAGVAARSLLPADTVTIDLGDAALNVNTPADLARARAWPIE